MEEITISYEKLPEFLQRKVRPGDFLKAVVTAIEDGDLAQTHVKVLLYHTE